MDEDLLKISEGRLLVTHQIANEILCNFAFKGQRKLIRPHVSAMSFDMKRGLFLSGTQIDFGMLPDGTMELINGQHRLMAVIESGISVEFMVCVHRCKNREILNRTYTKFDTGQKPRSKSTIVSLCDFVQEAKIRRPIAAGAMSAVGIIANRLHVSSISHPLPTEARSTQSKFLLMEPLLPQIKLYDDISMKCLHGIYTRTISGPFMAPLLIILRDQTEKGIKYLSGLVDPSGLERGDPRLTLHLAISNSSWTKGKRVSCVTFAVANTWNSFVKGKRVDIIRDYGENPNLIGCKID